MAVFDDTLARADKLLVYPHEITWQNNQPVSVTAEPERPAIPEAEPLKQESLHFLDCVSSGRPPITDGAEGLRVLRVLNASQKSLDDAPSGLTTATTSVRREVGVADGSALSSTPSAATAEKSALPYSAHPSAFIDEGAQIGADTRIWDCSHVMQGSVVGRGCNVGQNVVIGPDARIGDQCKIQNNVSVYKGVTLEDKVFCGPSGFHQYHQPKSRGGQDGSGYAHASARWGHPGR